MASASELASSDLLTKLITEDLLARSASKPIYLSAIEINGGETFSNNFFKKLLSPLVETSDYTLSQLITNVETSYSKLIKTDVFKSVGISLYADYANQSPKSLKNYNKEKSIPTKVVFDLTPFKLNIGEGFITFNNDDHLNVNLNYLNNNFNENAELVNIGVNYNPYKPNEHLISNGKFIANLNNPSFKFIIDLFNTHQNNKSWQQNLGKSSGGVIGLQYTNSSKNLSILNGLSLSRRSVHEIGDAAPDNVRSFSGEFIKSSIMNQFIFNDLKYLNIITKNFPINGYNIALSNELSSNQEQENPNNQATFNKTSSSFNLYKSFFDNNITTHLSKELGFIYSNGKTDSSGVHIFDRFYLGGINSFKGFGRNTVNVDGGLQFYKLGLTIYAKLPSFIYSPHKVSATNISSLEDGLGFEANPLRLYADGLVGNVGNNLLNDKLNNGVASVGFGLKYINHWANFDIGYYSSRRFTSEGSDASFGIKDGLQFAVSIGGSNSSL